MVKSVNALTPVTWGLIAGEDEAEDEERGIVLHVVTNTDSSAAKSMTETVGVGVTTQISVMLSGNTADGDAQGGRCDYTQGSWPTLDRKMWTCQCWKGCHPGDSTSEKRESGLGRQWKRLSKPLVNAPKVEDDPSNDQNLVILLYAQM